MNKETYEKLKEEKKIIRGDDGFLIFFPEDLKGGFTAQMLHDIALRMRQADLPWENEIELHFLKEDFENVGSLNLDTEK